MGENILQTVEEILNKINIKINKKLINSNFAFSTHNYSYLNSL